MKIVFTPDFLRRLDLLTVVSKRLFAGRMKGERRSPRKGSSVEFADFRNYVQGDDHRYIDWNAYARFEGLFVKLFMEEEDLQINLLLDRSKSMDFGGKFQMAASVAAALGYVGLANLDRVTVTVFSDAGVERLASVHGKGQVHKLLSFLEGVECAGRTDLTAQVKRFVEESTRPGLAIVISDFLDDNGFEQPLNLLRFHKFEPVAIQVLAREELDPPVGGDWRFIDSESGAAVDLALGGRAIKLYKQRLEAYTGALDQFCKSRDIACLRAAADRDFSELVLKYFREAALIA
jgi:uncharacterized protein (DUF58 family)